MRVGIVIPNYNGKILLKKNLPAITKLPGVSEIVVVDDGSTDGSAGYLKQEYPKLKLIEKVTNSGFATTVNLGVKALTTDIVVLLNTDVIPEKNFLESLLPHFQDPNVFSVGCLDQSIEKSGTVARGRGIGSFVRGFLQHKRGEIDKTDTLWVNGGSGGFRKSIWEKLGGLDEIYSPFYWEDIDLSYRAQKMGYSVIFEPNSVVVHRHDEGSIASNFSSEKIKTIAYRNQIIFVWKNITDPSLMLEHLLWVPYHSFRALTRSDTAFLKGLFQACLKIPKILRKRRNQKSSYKKSDVEILSNYTDSA